MTLRIILRLLHSKIARGGHLRGQVDAVESVLCSSFEPTSCRVGVVRRCGWPGLCSTSKIEPRWCIDPALFHFRLESHYDDLRSYVLCPCVERLRARVMVGDLTRTYLREVCNTYYEYLEAHCEVRQVKIIAVCTLRFG